LKKCSDGSVTPKPASLVIKAEVHDVRFVLWIQN
jgi:hypothetical protein